MIKLRMNTAENFITFFEDKNPIFAKELRKSYTQEKALFTELSSLMLDWAFATLGDDYMDKLVSGYCAFVVDVNRSQARYEKSGRYRHSSYQEVYEDTYSKPEFMNLYHWGVFTTTFAWLHHLELYRFFREDFLKKIKGGGDGKISLLDLGCGSGIWHFLAHHHLNELSTTAIDISETSIELTKKMSSHVGEGRVMEYAVSDAITWTSSVQFDATISCFLLEHLERPGALVENLARLTKPGGLSFITCALTAAEIDHIYEFKRESEVILMVEDAGFRVLKSFSSAPTVEAGNRKYLPRSMGLVLQKRKGEYW